MLHCVTQSAPQTNEIFNQSVRQIQTSINCQLPHSGSNNNIRLLAKHAAGQAEIEIINSSSTRQDEAGQVGHATSHSRSAVHFLYMQQTYLQIGAYLTLINTELH